jgi:hypothetical protein
MQVLVSVGRYRSGLASVEGWAFGLGCREQRAGRLGRSSAAPLHAAQFTGKVWSYLGIRTESITWITPLLQWMSALVTVRR